MLLKKFEAPLTKESFHKAFPAGGSQERPYAAAKELILKVIPKTDEETGENDLVTYLTDKKETNSGKKVQSTFNSVQILFFIHLGDGQTSEMVELMPSENAENEEMDIVAFYNLQKTQEDLMKQLCLCVRLNLDRNYKLLPSLAKKVLYENDLCGYHAN